MFLSLFLYDSLIFCTFVIPGFQSPYFQVLGIIRLQILSLKGYQIGIFVLTHMFLFCHFGKLNLMCAHRQRLSFCHISLKISTISDAVAHLTLCVINNSKILFFQKFIFTQGLAIALHASKYCTYHIRFAKFLI